MAKNQVVAIDIGTNTAKIVQLERTAAGLRLVHASLIAHAGGDEMQSVAALWARLSYRAPTGIQAIFSRQKTEVGVALPRHLVNTKRLVNLPAATDAQLANVVALAAETELPFRVEEAIFTYHNVQRNGEATSVELVSARRQAVEQYMEPLKQKGALPTAVIPAMVAIAEVSRLEETRSPDRIIVDIGAGQTDFCFMQNDSLRFSRSFRIGGNLLTENVMEAQNVDFETAEEEKRHLSARDAPMQGWTARFIGEIQRSIAAAQREMTEGAGHNATPELWLCGGGARVHELAEVCEEALNMPTRLWNPFGAMRAEMDVASADGLEEHGDMFAVPFGVALNTLDADARVSLLPKEAEQTLTQTARKRQVLVASAFGGAMAVGILFGGLTLQRLHQHRAESIDIRITDFTRSMDTVQTQLARELALTDMLVHHASPLDILHALSATFADRTQVAWTNLNVTNLNDPGQARITFNLEAASHNAINSLFSALNRSSVFTNVQLGEVTSASENRKTVFQVQVRCGLSASAVKAFAQKRYPTPEPPTFEEAEPNVEAELDPNVEAELDVKPPTSTLEEDKSDADEADEADEKAAPTKKEEKAEMEVAPAPEKKEDTPQQEKK